MPTKTTGKGLQRVTSRVWYVTNPDKPGRYISDAACGVRPITMHCASWPIRADFVEN